MRLRRAQTQTHRGYQKPWRLGKCGPSFQTSDSPWIKTGQPTKRKTFVALTEQACTALESRKSIPAEEIVSWPFVDDLRIFPRGATEVLTAPVVELGRAMIALLRSELPEAPKGEAWIFGTPAGRSTIRMDASWDGQW